MRNNQHESLRDFLAKHEALIKYQISSLNDEMKNIKMAIEALDEQKNIKMQTKPSKMTIKEIALLALSDEPKGLQTKEILEVFQKRFGVAIKRCSLQPQLSRLIKAGKLGRYKGVYFLSPHGDFKAPQGGKNTSPEFPSVEATRPMTR